MDSRCISGFMVNFWIHDICLDSGWISGFTMDSRLVFKISKRPGAVRCLLELGVEQLDNLICEFYLHDYYQEICALAYSGKEAKHMLRFTRNAVQLNAR